MATGTRSGVSAAVPYEDISLMFEWKEEDKANILIIHAPDFAKEQLKITYVHSTRILRVSGERQDARNKWYRYNQTFPVPQNCDVQNIQAKFVDGKLTITLPKSIITQPTPPKPEPKPTTATQEAVVPPPKPAASTTPTPPVLPQSATTEPKEPKGVEEKGKATATLQKVPTLQEPLKDSKPQKGQEDQATLRAPSSKLDDTTLLKQKDENFVKEKKAASVGGDQKSLPEQDREEIGKKRKESLQAPPEGDKESVKKRKESLLEKERPSIYKDDSVGGKVKNVAAAAKDAVKGFAMEMREDRQKMVNIGFAVLVIAAVGAYLYHRYKSPGNAQGNAQEE